MIKRIISYVSFIALLFVVVFFTHQNFIRIENLRYSLFFVYLFHSISTLIIYVLIEVISMKLPNQAGYAYLASIFLKIGFFVLLFSATVFSDVVMEKEERISLVIPLFLFLIAETIAVSRLLNSK
jgi:hypothetical protein